jgi:hypothetical protein
VDGFDDTWGAGVPPEPGATRRSPS